MNGIDHESNTFTAAMQARLRAFDEIGECLDAASAALCGHDCDEVTPEDIETVRGCVDRIAELLRDM